MIDCWSPMFAVEMGISRDRMEDLSVLAMVDHVQYLNRAEGVTGGG